MIGVGIREKSMFYLAIIVNVEDISNGHCAHNQA